MIDFEEDWLASVVFRWRGSVAPRALWFALPCACLAPLLLLLGDMAPQARQGMALEFMASSVLWSSTTACITFLVGFRTKHAIYRFWEGTGLLHQMRGEWFDAASCLTTFSRSAKTTKLEAVNEFRGTLVRLMSLLHGSALEEIKTIPMQNYEVIDIRGLDPQTRCILGSCKTDSGYNRVEILLHMVQVLITQNLDEGVLNIAPPILSRVYQTLSRGYVNLLDSKKITDTKFPFPLAQLLSGLLIFHALFTPVVIAAVVDHKVWAALLAFLPVFGLSSLNFAAIEIESPFGNGDNDLPLEDFQQEMNNSLLMLFGDEADHLAHKSRGAIEVDVLKKSMAKHFAQQSRKQLQSHGTISSQLASLGRFSFDIGDPDGEDAERARNSSAVDMGHMSSVASVRRLNQILGHMTVPSWGSSASQPSDSMSIFDTKDLSRESITEARVQSTARSSVRHLSMRRSALLTNLEEVMSESSDTRYVERVSRAATSKGVGFVVEQQEGISGTAALRPKRIKFCEASDEDEGPPHEGGEVDRRMLDQNTSALKL